MIFFKEKYIIPIDCDLCRRKPLWSSTILLSTLAFSLNSKNLMELLSSCWTNSSNWNIFPVFKKLWENIFRTTWYSVLLSIRNFCTYFLLVVGFVCLFWSIFSYSLFFKTDDLSKQGSTVDISWISVYAFVYKVSVFCFKCSHDFVDLCTLYSSCGVFNL